MALKILYFGTNHPKSIKPLQALDQDQQIVGVVEWSPKKSAPKKVLRQIYHYGKGLRGEEKTLGSFAKKRNILHIDTNVCPVNSKVFEERVKSLQPDLICVSYFGDRIPTSVMKASKLGGINAHGSYLPNYRGAIPWFWQYYHMEEEGGVTIHRLTDKQDEGEILVQEKFPIELGLTEERLLQKITDLTVKLMREAVADIEKTGRVGRGKMTDSEEAPDHLIRGRCIQRKERFIDWETWNVDRVYHFLRGTGAMELNAPYPGGIWNVLGFQRCDPEGKPGEIEKRTEGHRLYCKNGIVLLKSRFSMKALVKGLI